MPLVQDTSRVSSPLGAGRASTGDVNLLNPGKGNWKAVFGQDAVRSASAGTVSIRIAMVGLHYDYYSNLVVHPKRNGGEGTGFYNPDGLLDHDFHVGPIRDVSNPYNPDAGVNLGPRFGFSYNPAFSSKTVIRGGFGVLFSAQQPGAMRQSAQSAPNVPFRSALSQQDIVSLGLKWPLYNDDFRKIVAAQNTQSGVTNVFSVFDPNIQNPYSMQYSLGIQRELTSSLVLETAYV